MKDPSMEKERTEIVFRYLGDVEYINADTLYLSQLDFIKLLQEALFEIDPKARLSVKIYTYKKGSFSIEQVIEISRIATGLLALFDHRALIPQLLEFVKEYLELKKVLRGEKPKEILEQGETVKIVPASPQIDNSQQVNLNINAPITDSTVSITQNVFQAAKTNVGLDEASSRFGERIYQDPDIEGVEAEARGKPFIRLNRKDFIPIIARNPLLDPPERTLSISKAGIIVLKPELFPGKAKESKWDFIIDNRIVRNVVIKDEDFLHRVWNGEESFRSGDGLLVDLEILQEYAKEAKTYKDKQYTVTKVHEVVHSPIQTELF